MRFGKRAVRSSRRAHEQLEMLDASGKRPVSRRGGFRERAGRPRKGSRAGAPHKKRAAFASSNPLHVVLRVCPEVGNLRNARVYRAIRRATVVAGKHEEARIVHLSIQRNHLHLLVEAAHRLALASTMQAFQISAAKQINRAVGGRRRRRGQVFADRYHAEVITSPRYMRHVLSYVMNNWRKHGEDELDEVARMWQVDPYSTGVLFNGWKELGDGKRWEWRATYEPMSVWEPRTWLLRVGWRRHGLVGCREVPSGEE